MNRIGFRTLKSIIAIMLCLCLYMGVAAIGEVTNIETLKYLFIPIISCIVSVLLIAPKTKDYKRILAANTTYYIVVVAFALLVTALYELIFSKSWPYLIQTKPIDMLFPTIFIIVGALLMTYIAILLKLQKLILHFFIIYMLVISVNFTPNKGHYYNFSFIIVSILVGSAVAFFVNSFKMKYRHYNNRLFIYNLDNIFEADKTSFDEYEKAILTQLVVEGARISYTSSYSLPIASELLNNITVTEPILCLHGAMLYDLNNNLFLHNETFEKNISNMIENTFKDLKHGMFKFFVYDNLFYVYNNYTSNYGDLLYKEYIKNCKLCNFLGRDNREFLASAYYVVDTKEKIIEIKNHLQGLYIYENINIIMEKIRLGDSNLNFYSLLIVSKNLEKQKALTKLKLNDTSYVISSQLKDELLINKADYVVTNKNANDDIKFKANYIINSNRRHSLVRVIRKLYYK